MPRNRRDDPYGFAFGKQQPTPKQEYASPDRIEADAAARRDKILKLNATPPPPEEHSMPEFIGPPTSTMQQYNLWLPMIEVNKKVDQITKAHKNVTGVDPTPGLVRDLLINDEFIKKAAVSYTDMFSRSNTPLKAWRTTEFNLLMEQAKEVGSTPHHEMGFPGVDEIDWGIPGLYNTRAPEGSPAYQQVEQYNQWIVSKTRTSQEGLAGLFGGDLSFTRDMMSGFLGIGPVINLIQQTRVGRQVVGAAPDAISGALADTAIGRAVGGETGRPFVAGARGISQIQNSFLDLPQGVILTVNALALDALDSPSLLDVWNGKRPLTDVTPRRTLHIVKEGALQMKEDFTNPEENLGYLALDVFGAASVGAGAYLRIGAGLSRAAVARAAVRGGDIGAVKLGEEAIYRPAAAGVIEEGPLKGHLYYRTPQEAQEVAGEGADIVRADLPAVQLSAYAPTPEVQPGMTRLYRAEGGMENKPLPSWMEGDPRIEAHREAQGRWFAATPEEAQWYLENERMGGRIVHVDVKSDLADQMRVSNQPEEVQAFSRKPEEEFFVTPETAAAAKPLHPPDMVFSTELATTPVVAPGKVAASSFVLGQAGKGLFSRPVGGSGVYGFDDFAVTVPYFDNALAKLVQKGYLKLTVGQLKARQIHGEYIFGDNWLDNLFAPERKVRSLMDAEQELRIGMMQAPLLALQRYKRWDSVGKQILKDLFTQPRAMSSFLALHEKEAIAMDKAALLLATDSNYSIADWVTFHQNQIADAETALSDLEKAGPDPTKPPVIHQRKLDHQNYKITAHQAQLEAIDLAVELITEGSPLFDKVYGQMVRVARIRDNIQRTTLGLDDRTMDQSVAAVTFQLQDITTAFDTVNGRFVFERGTDARAEAFNKVEDAGDEILGLESQLKDAQAKAGSRRVKPTARDRKVMADIQDKLDVAREYKAQKEAELAELGGAPEKIPLTRVVLSPEEKQTRAVRALQVAQASNPSLEVQRAITFLEQGEHPNNVAAYLGQVIDRWGDPDAWAIEDPAWGALQGVQEAIDQLGGVPIDNVLHGKPHETATPGGKLVQEFRTLEAIVNEARVRGVDPRTLTEGKVWARWAEINRKLGIDPDAVGHLRPDDPAVFAKVMTRAGSDMVKSPQAAHFNIEIANTNLDAINVGRADPHTSVEHWRNLEAEVIEIEREHDAAISEMSDLPIDVGSSDWQEWANNVGFTEEQISVMRNYIAMSESMGLKTWESAPYDPSTGYGGFEGYLTHPDGISDEEVLHTIEQSQRMGDDWHGWAYEDAVEYEEKKIAEAEAFLDGKTSEAQRYKADQILLEEKYMNDDSGTPMGSVISHEELVSRAYEATVPEKIQKAQARLEERRAEADVAAFHVPSRREIYREEKPAMRRLFHRMTNHGFLPPKMPDSHRHRTGSAIVEGDARWDTSNLLIEQYGDVLRIGSALQLHRELFKSHDEGGPALDIGSAADPNEDQVATLTGRHQPIRDIRDAPQALQEFVAAMQRLEHIDAKDLKLMREEMDKLSAFLYPSKAEAAQIAAAGGHVRWVDERFITQHPMGMDVTKWRNLDTGIGQMLGPINEMWRLMLLFASPAYALNALGSGALLLTKQGFLAPKNLGRAIASRHIYGEEVTRMLDAIAGNTHAMSYLSDSEKSLATGLSRLLTNAWQYLTDTHFRRAAVIHELRRRGMLKDGLSPDQLADQLLSQDPEIKRIVTEAMHAGRNGMLNFNRMSWPERAIARHLFFIYSFMRASAAYSLHYLFEHPAQHAILGAVGRDREDLIKELIGDNLPQWFYDQGWIAIGPGEVINPSQLNMAAVLNQLSNPLQAMFQNTPYGDATGFAGGGVLAYTELLTGRNLQTGEKFDRGAAIGTALDLYMKTPLGRVSERMKKEDEPQTPPAMSITASAANPIEAARASERAATGMSSFHIDGWWDTWGRFLGRSAVPQHPNVPALQAKQWRDLRLSNPEAYYQHERDLVQEMVDAQEVAIGRDAPQEVRAAVDFVSRYVQHMNAWREGKIKGMGPPRDPNVRMNAQETLRWLKEEKLISNEDYRVRMANVRDPSRTKSEVQREAIGAMWDNGGKAWQQWNSQVKKVDFFVHEDYPVVLQRIENDGLGDYTATVDATQEQKWQYGRAALKYSERLQKLRLRASTLQGDEQTQALDQIKQFEDSNDHDVIVDHLRFPPLTVAGDRDSSFARQTEPERKDWIVTRQLRTWGGLSNYEKRVLTGERRDPAVTLGWRTLHQWLAQDRAALAPGKKIPSGTRKYYAESIAAQVPAFKKDWEESLQPLAQRMQSYSTIKKSRYAEEWSTLLTTAADYATSATEGGWTQTDLGGLWKRDGLAPVTAWIARQETGFRAEVQTYIDANPNFLTRLVKS